MAVYQPRIDALHLSDVSWVISINLDGRPKSSFDRTRPSL